MIGNKSLLLYKSKAQMLQYDRVGDKSFFNLFNIILPILTFFYWGSNIGQ